MPNHHYRGHAILSLICPNPWPSAPQRSSSNSSLVFSKIRCSKFLAVHNHSREDLISRSNSSSLVAPHLSRSGGWLLIHVYWFFEDLSFSIGGFCLIECVRVWIFELVADGLKWCILKDAAVCVEYIPKCAILCLGLGRLACGKAAFGPCCSLCRSHSFFKSFFRKPLTHYQEPLGLLRLKLAFHQLCRVWSTPSRCPFPYQ